VKRDSARHFLFEGKKKINRKKKKRPGPLRNSRKKGKGPETQLLPISSRKGKERKKEKRYGKNPLAVIGGRDKKLRVV